MEALTYYFPNEGKDAVLRLHWGEIVPLSIRVP